MTHKLAHPNLRLLAWLLDVVMSFAFFGYTLFLLSQSTSPIQALNSALNLVTIWLLTSASLGFVNAYLVSAFGGTLGKLLTGIAVVDSKGAHLSYPRSIFRLAVGYFVSGSLLWLGFLWAFFDKNRQTWHDLISDSLVVVINPRGWLLGLLCLLGSTFATYQLVQSSIQNFSFHKQVYQDIYSALEPTPTPQPKYLID